MIQRFSKPDCYLARCGHLDAVVTEHRIEGAPSFMHGLRAVFIADTHVLKRTTQDEINALAGRIADARPTILLLGGDYSDTASDCVRFFSALGRLSIPLRAYGVLGNNDAEAWEGNLRELRRVMARSGCKLLLNQVNNIALDGGTLSVGGIDEYHYGNPAPYALWHSPPHASEYRILLSHYPVLPIDRPDLMLCGHTHGGQFNLFGMTPFSIGFERYGRPRRASAAISGLHDVDGMKLLVSKGVGASRLQLRVGVRPEINLLSFA